MKPTKPFMMRGAGKAMAKKIIAVYGSSGSYKTTTAIALAHYISKTDPGANIILVGTDTTKPILPLIAPNEKKFKGSIGYCLSAVSFEQDILFRYFSFLFIEKTPILSNF